MLTERFFVGDPLARARAPGASYPKDEVIGPLFEFLNAAAW